MLEFFFFNNSPGIFLKVNDISTKINIFEKEMQKKDVLRIEE